jgi:hypothetical protein
MRRRMGFRVLFVALIVALSGLVVASPAAATGSACGSGPKCFLIYGSGNHVYPRVCMKTTNGLSSTGHMQIRWRKGVDHYANSNEGRIGPSYVCFNIDFTVDSNTYVCGRWWHWTGSTWILPYGDWTCVKTHP